MATRRSPAQPVKPAAPVEEEWEPKFQVGDRIVLELDGTDRPGIVVEDSEAGGFHAVLFVPGGGLVPVSDAGDDSDARETARLLK